MSNIKSHIESWITPDQSYDLNSFAKLSILEQEQIKDIEAFYNYAEIAC
jgi:hypothetical protein